MGFFSKFERRVEDGFDDMGDKMFDSPISPVQIAKKAEKQMRREKMVGAGKEFAPTLYTVLVNPEDDERLFGYYPTLAGETETYLRGKAQELGLAMDGAPLVRFIIDDELKHGKFEVVAELVSAPIVEQLRAEEMQRYGLEAQGAPAPAPAPQQQAPRPQQAVPNPQAAPVQQAQPMPQGQPTPAPQGHPYASTGIDVMAEDPQAYIDVPSISAPNTRVPGPQGQPAQPMKGQAGYAANQYGAPVQQAPGYDDGYGMQPPMGRHMPQQPRLIDLTTNHSFPLAQDRIVLGRALSSDIAIEDLNVSRTHAEIRHEAANSWSIADLGSTNGTLVNGRHIASTMLQEGDRVTVGTTTFLFTFQ